MQYSLQEEKEKQKCTTRTSTTQQNARDAAPIRHKSGEKGARVVDRCVVGPLVFSSSTQSLLSGSHFVFQTLGCLEPGKQAKQSERGLEDRIQGNSAVVFLSTTNPAVARIGEWAQCATKRDGINNVVRTANGRGL